jgi:hypothetical protein
MIVDGVYFQFLLFYSYKPFERTFPDQAISKFQTEMVVVNRLPAQIVGGAKRPSFAFSTVTERWPKIIAGIVDRLHQSYHKTVTEHGQVPT